MRREWEIPCLEQPVDLNTGQPQRYSPPAGQHRFIYLDLGTRLPDPPNDAISVCLVVIYIILDLEKVKTTADDQECIQEPRCS